MAAANSPTDASEIQDTRVVDEGKVSFKLIFWPFARYRTFAATYSSMLTTDCYFLFCLGSLPPRWCIRSHRRPDHNTECKHHPWKSHSHWESKLTSQVLVKQGNDHTFSKFNGQTWGRKHFRAETHWLCFSCTKKRCQNARFTTGMFIELWGQIMPLVIAFPGQRYQSLLKSQAKAYWNPGYGA